MKCKPVKDHHLTPQARLQTNSTLINNNDLQLSKTIGVNQTKIKMKMV